MSPLCLEDINGEQCLASTALLCARFVPLVGQKMLQRSQKIRSKSPLGGMHRPEVILFQEPREKCLSQVLRILGAVAFAPHERINRQPISLTQSLERASGRG